MADRSAARAAKSTVVAAVSGSRVVNGVGIGHRPDGWVVKVNLRQDDLALRQRLPSELDGVPVLVEVVGEVSALPA